MSSIFRPFKGGLFSAAVFRAMLTWPKFSFTSFVMVSALVRQRILPVTVIDVGANVGQFAVACAKLLPSPVVHSFEPHPESVQALMRNVGVLGKVTVHSLALGETEGEVDFHVNSHSHSSSILPLADNHRGAFPQAREVGTIKVRLSTLDRVFYGIELVGPVLLKLDVQGYEVQVLRGGLQTLKQVDHVVLETSFKPMYEGELLFMDIVKMMDGYGFEFLRPVGWLNDPETDEIIQMDALFKRR